MIAIGTAVSAVALSLAPGHTVDLPCKHQPYNFGIYHAGHVERLAYVQKGSGALVFRSGVVAFADRSGIEVQNGSHHPVQVRMSCGEA